MIPGAFSLLRGRDMKIHHIGQDDLALLVLAIGVVIALARLGLRIFRFYRPRITLGDYMRGTVYIFLDRSLRGTVIKIGMTQRKRVEIRMEEVMRDMGGDLILVYKVMHVPFPFAVECAAHQLMARRRIRWGRGSRRGTEWFKVGGDRGITGAIVAVEKAARLVRTLALRKKRWPAKADTSVSSWRYSGGKVFRYTLFR
jgi:hypothetical protein